MGVPALASRWSERGGEFQIHAVGGVEGRDRDAESGQVLDLTVLDVVPLWTLSGGARPGPRPRQERAVGMPRPAAAPHTPQNPPDHAPRQPARFGAGRPLAGLGGAAKPRTTATRRSLDLPGTSRGR